MRSIPAILATLAIASVGVQALLPPEQPTRRAYESSAMSSSTTPPYHPPEPTKPVHTTTSKSEESYKPEPTSTYTPDHPKPSDKPEEPEYETVCQTFAFFHGWDLYGGDLSSGPTEGKYIYDCAKDCSMNGDCDATVFYNGYCYPKTLDLQSSKPTKEKDRDLAILGSCEDLQKANEHSKHYPDGFLDCCYDKDFCTKVYKDGSKKW